MNEVIEAIISRRSIRKFKTTQISDADRDLILRAGLYAPSAKNTQPWHITVVQNLDIIDEITSQTKAALLRAQVAKYAGLAKSEKYTVNFGAPTFMLVSASPSVSDSYISDGSLVLCSMFLAAHSLGIGSCWVNQLGAITDEPKFRSFLTERLAFPAEMQIVGCAAFGFNAADHPQASPRKERSFTLIK